MREHASHAGHGPDYTRCWLTAVRPFAWLRLGPPRRRIGARILPHRTARGVGAISRVVAHALVPVPAGIVGRLHGGLPAAPGLRDAGRASRCPKPGHRVVLAGD